MVEGFVFGFGSGSLRCSISESESEASGSSFVKERKGDRYESKRPEGV